jgi:hypothetical protein
VSVAVPSRNGSSKNLLYVPENKGGTRLLRDSRPLLEFCRIVGAGEAPAEREKSGVRAVLQVLRREHREEVAEVMGIAR